jgi:hypothetical protein
MQYDHRLGLIAKVAWSHPFLKGIDSKNKCEMAEKASAPIHDGKVSVLMEGSHWW